MPLLDHELVEMAAAIPGELKVKGGTLKHLMKAALVPTLPDDILHRAKRGFGTPMGAWLKKELLAVVRELLSPAVVRRRGLFDGVDVRHLRAEAHGDARCGGHLPAQRTDNQQSHALLLRVRLRPRRRL